MTWLRRQVGSQRVPGLDASQISNDVIKAMLFDFLPAWDGNAADFSAGA